MSEIDLDALSTGIMRVDAAGLVCAVNRAAAELIGLSARDVHGKPLAAVEPELDARRQRAEASGRILSVPEMRLRDTLVDLIVQPADDGVLIELHPVAQRVRQREMAERADRHNAVSLLARRLAHELRNPLAGIRGGAQLIAAGSNPTDTGRHARMIQREVDRMTALIERLVDDSTLNPQPTNLHRVLSEAGELAVAESQGRTTLERDFDPSIPDICADGGQLHQLFLNLLRNALRANARLIRLTTRIEHDCALLDEAGRHAVRIDIDDDGSGVPESLRDRLFLPMVSGHDSGSGFGLAIVQQIARGHGGLVEYQPLNQGSRFRVRLPLILPDEHLP